ncbi:MAG: radical SAM protein [Bacteroidales bacterium]|nr:radical SAM protein [Bacteroidales bacterium]
MSRTCAFPIFIDVELTNKCNLECLFCVTGTGMQIRKAGYMSDETFMKIMDNIKDKESGLRFMGWGEPTLHPRLADYIRIAKKAGHLTHLSTNGQLVDKNLADKLLDSGLDSIIFTFQGVNKQQYEEVMHGGDYDKLLTNVRTLFQKRGNRSLPFIHCKTSIINESDIEDIEIFKKKVEPICDLVTCGATQFNHINLDKVKLDKGSIEKLKIMKTKEQMLKRHKICGPCWGMTVIDYQGHLHLCNHDFNEEMLIGDINNNTISEIFNGNKKNEYRDLILNTIIPKQEFFRNPICNDCYDYMSWEERLVRIQENI